MRSPSAEGLAVDFEDDGALDESVEKGHGEGSVGEIVGPLFEVDVGDEGGGTMLMS